jgi:arginine exporter protein ArgO
LEALPPRHVTAALVAGLLAGYGIAVPVGAIATYLVALTARTSMRIGASAALGVATADGVYASLAVVGGRSFASLIEPAAGGLRIASGVVLFGLAARIGVQAVRHGLRGAAAPGLRDRASAARTYLSLMGITMLNPMTIVYFTALVVDHRSAAVASAPDGAVFVLAAFAASASWQLTLAGSGAVLGRVLTSDRGRMLSGLASGLLIGALAVNVLR